MKKFLTRHGLWLLLIAVFCWSAYRLLAAPLIWMLALTPVLAVATLGELYEDLKKTPNRIIFKIPLLKKFLSNHQFNERQKKIIATLAVAWSFFVVLLYLQIM